MSPTSKGFATILALFGVLGLALTAMANEPGAQGRAKAPEYAGAPFDKTNALQQRAEVHARSTALELRDDSAPPGPHWYCVTAEGAKGQAKAPPLARTSPCFVTVE